ncbi:Modification methylase PvuII [Burkholderia cepacia]|uniref:DNA-methyltransferase n=1 Tax=Burkholderia cepacia TaxID=292 RepID=UPI001CB0058A|nr:site-specific DNA-methyltransferase [Burkholderia cepacia]CAG9272461.1 Modification methylase PvuII [Burkholderia cepacia]
MRPRKKPTDFLPKFPGTAAYSTARGVMLQGLAEEALAHKDLDAVRGKVQLIFTSPPFPLNTKKKYGNLQGEEYLEWFSKFGPLFRELLAPDGSIVIELGNSWEPGLPTMSTLALKALLRFQEANDLHLCQEFICHNPARLPSPAQWVTIERIRLKDSFTRLWWLSPTPRPKANNKNVLVDYSPSMRRLLKTKQYNSGKRPSEHWISEESFAKDHGGAISPNVLSIANTRANDAYQQYCRDNNIIFHPARMPVELPEFFVNFLTDPEDIVLDPFGGSNTTGAAAENLDRRWISVEPQIDYIRGSIGRFDAEAVHVTDQSFLATAEDADT